MPKVKIPPLTREDNPSHPMLGPSLAPYSHAILGDGAGLTQFGVHIEVLPPGSRSSFRHWHETEDELVYILSGEVVLIEDDETILRAGDAAAWPAGNPVGHCLENRSSTDATYLTIGTRDVDDVIHYPDHDLVTHKTGTKRRYTRGDGSPVS